jgi:hypothetical protein
MTTCPDSDTSPHEEIAFDASGGVTVKGVVVCAAIEPESARSAVKKLAASFERVI